MIKGFSASAKSGCRVFIQLYISSKEVPGPQLKNRKNQSDIENPLNYPELPVLSLLWTAT